MGALRAGKGAHKGKGKKGQTDYLKDDFLPEDQRPEEPLLRGIGAAPSRGPMQVPMHLLSKGGGGGKGNRSSGGGGKGGSGSGSRSRPEPTAGRGTQPSAEKSSF